MYPANSSAVGNPRRDLKVPAVTRDSHRRLRLIELLFEWTGLNPDVNGHRQIF